MADVEKSVTWRDIADIYTKISQLDSRITVLMVALDGAVKDLKRLEESVYIIQKTLDNLTIAMRIIRWVLPIAVSVTSSILVNAVSKLMGM